jgi:Mg/Co/Ni transporter MgtE
MTKYISNEQLFALCFLAGVFLILRLLRNQNASQQSKINLDYLIVDYKTGVISPVLIVFLGGYLFVTAAELYLLLTGAMNLGYLTAYIVQCVVPVTMAVLKRDPATAAPVATTTTTTETVTTAGKRKAK